MFNEKNVIKLAILGLGGRGQLYADIIKNRCAKNVEVVAVCDILPDKQKLAVEKYGLPPSMVFSDYKAMFSRGKIADALIVSTQDADHYKHTMAALDAGYDILLEKPISPVRRECEAIARKAALLGRKVSVAHVLRYTPFYEKLKEIIDGGIIGRVMTVSQTENVCYSHQAHSFVRGNWRNSRESAPMILAKSCHDMDILKWLVGFGCAAVSSFGSLGFYTRENAPKNSAERCADCELRAECVYDAERFYRQSEYVFGLINKGDSDVKRVLKTSPYGRCVWKCDNDVVDHQVVNMLFENGATAQFTMTAFSAVGDRNIRIHGTEGDIEGSIEEGKIEVRIFGKPEQNRLFKIQLGTNLPGEHTGGDEGLLQDFVAYIAGNGMAKALTTIDASLESHVMCFLAERSRLNGGTVYKLNKS